MIPLSTCVYMCVYNLDLVLFGESYFLLIYLNPFEKNTFTIPSGITGHLSFIFLYKNRMHHKSVEIFNIVDLLTIQISICVTTTLPFH